MSETIKIEAAIPVGFHRAALIVCDTFHVAFDEFIANAIRGELQALSSDNCESYTIGMCRQLAQQLKEVAGEDL